jgi:hypothetical protein
MNINPLFVIIFSILIYLIYKDLTFKNIQTIEGFDIGGAGMIIENNKITMKKQLAAENNSILIGDSNLINTNVPSTGKNNPTANGFRLFFDNSYNGTKGSGMPANKIVLHNNNFTAGFGIESDSVTYHSGNCHAFYTITNNTNAYGIERMRILGNGNIGINISNPSAGIHVNKNNTNEVAFKASSSGNGWGSGIVFENSTINVGKSYGIYSGADGGLHFSDNDNATDRIFISKLGLIGINTKNPLGLLDIIRNERTNPENHSKTIPPLYITCSNYEASDGVEFRHSNGSQGIGFGYNSIYATGSNADQPLNIIPRGNSGVGIGTTTPAQKLHVVGDAILTNTLGGGTLYSWDAHHSIWMRKGYKQEHDVFDIHEYGTIRFFTGGSIDQQPERMRINPNGFVGIGTNDPQAPLEVAGFAGLNTSRVGDKGGTFTYFADSGKRLDSLGTTESANFSIIASHSIGGLNFMSNSDKRIKQDIEILNNDIALHKLRNIEPMQYTHIDKLTNGSQLVYGFIAQQVKEYIPSAISYKSSYIPNIYKLCPYTKQTNKNILIDIETTDLSINDRLKLIQNNNANIYGTIKNKTDLNIIVELDNELNIDDNEDDNKIIVYGKEINDFHTVNKDQLLAVNFAATKELDKKVQVLEEENKQLKQEVSELKSLLQQVLAKLQ